jgi:hypothetical protein
LSSTVIVEFETKNYAKYKIYFHGNCKRTSTGPMISFLNRKFWEQETEQKDYKKMRYKSNVAGTRQFHASVSGI